MKEKNTMECKLRKQIGIALFYQVCTEKIPKSSIPIQNRKFCNAYPVINDVILNIKSNDGSLNKKKDEANERMIILDNAIEDLTQKIANKKEYTKEDLLLFKEELKQLKKERRVTIH